VSYVVDFSVENVEWKRFA
jgi:hypothetical protein